MNRILLSVILSFVFVLVYTGLALSLVFGQGNGLANPNRRISRVVFIPMNLPDYLFSTPKSGYNVHDTKPVIVRLIVSVVLNILIYSIPIYGLLSLISKHLTKNKDLKRETPPPPPPIF
jgi:hypothetical protein